MSPRFRRFLPPVVIGGTFLVLAVSAVVFGIASFRHPVGKPDSPPTPTPFVIWAAVFGLATYKTLTGRLFAGHRWARIDRQLSEAGFRQATEQEVEHTAGIPVLLLSPKVLGTDRGGGLDHVSIRSVGSREVRVFRARVRGAGRWIDVPAVGVRVPAHLAPTIIRPARRGLRPPINMKRVFFELESFNRSVEVRSVDRFFASAFLDPRMIEWLGHHLGRTVIELADRWVIVWSNALLGSPVSPLQLIESLAAFNDHIPRSAPSLFPQRPISTVWIHRRKHAGFSGWLDRLSHMSDLPGDSAVD